VKAVSRVAAAALLARYFPPAKGGRNEAFMAIAGTLARARWAEKDVIEFNFTIYSVLWPGTADRSVCASEVKPTFTKYAAGKDTIGATRLKKLIDERVVATVLRWLDIAPEGPPHPADVAQGPDVSKAADTSTELDASPEPGAEEQLEAPPEDAGTESDSDALPDIRTNGRELRDVSTDARAALLLANNPPKLFSRAGAPVRVDLTEDGHPIIVTLTDTHVRGEMTRERLPRTRKADGQRGERGARADRGSLRQLPVQGGRQIQQGKPDRTVSHPGVAPGHPGQRTMRAARCATNGQRKELGRRGGRAKDDRRGCVDETGANPR
jgi:hypothetical protein